MPAVYVSNCLLYAGKEYRRRFKAWKDGGHPWDMHPWLHARPSKSQPDWVLHWWVGGMGLPSMEFVPVERKDVPWYLAWTRIRFTGRERPVDFPRTEPSAHGDL